MRQLRVSSRYILSYQLKYTRSYQENTLKMASSTKSANTSFLNGPNDWDQWDKDFRTKAVALSIWETIDPENPEPFIEKPETPDINKLLHIPFRGGNACPNTRNQKSATPIGDEDHEVMKDEQTRYTSFI